jgi:hypothetical protein
MAEAAGLCARVACLQVGPGPHWSAAVGHFDPGTKCSANCFYSQKSQILVQTCKIHILFSVCQKNVYNMSKCSENCNLQVYDQCMHD